MFNDQYVQAYIDILRQNEEMYYQDFLEMQCRVNHSNAIYKGEPIPVTYQGLFYDSEQVRDFQLMANMLMAIGRKITNRYLADAHYRSLFQYPKQLEELILHDPGYDVPVPICRYDVFYNNSQEYKFCEFNTDGASAMNEDNTIGGIMLQSKGMQEMAKKYHLTNVELIRPWVKISLDMYRQYWDSEKKPNVAIVDLLDLGTPYEFEEFRKAYEGAGISCKICDARELEYKNGRLYQGDYPIDLVYRRLVTVEMMRNISHLKQLIDAYLDNAFMMIGSIRSQIMHNKLIFKILRLPETQAFLSAEENAFLSRTIPYTEEFKTDLDFQIVLANKDQYILKPYDEYASHGVYSGREHTREKWKAILERTIGTGYIYQKYHDVEKIRFVEFDSHGRLLVHRFGSVIGMFIYNEQFQAPYTRIGNRSLISGARDYYTVPNILIEEK